MQTVHDIAKEIVAREGGYVNDPDDPGGATNFGVTIHTMCRLGLDLDRDGDVDTQDVRALSRAQAVDIFVTHYFERPLIAELPEALHATVFDMYVNAGSNAVKILQRLLTEMGYPCSVDGALGPQTIGAARAAYASASGYLVDAYGIARRNYYLRIADRRPASRKYAGTRAGGKGGLDQARRRIHLAAVPPERGPVSEEGIGMGLMERMFGQLFGSGRNVVKDTVEVFRENAEAGAVRSQTVQMQAMKEFGQEFLIARHGAFDRFMDGLNRLPRPALALGTLGLFISAMVAPLWFSERMQGIALVPEPMWWLLGVIVSFYFGARHQIKAQQFQREIVETMNRVPQAIENIAALREMRADSVGVADTGEDARLTTASLLPDQNPALDEWRRAA
jgi:holin (3TMs family)/glycosyl hydrolase family 108/predicted peptidoglycan binding protein